MIGVRRNTVIGVRPDLLTFSELKNVDTSMFLKAATSHTSPNLTTDLSLF